MIDELRKRVFDANMALCKHGLVTLTWGNVSARDPQNGRIIIKPSGVSYETMTPDDMVVLDADGNVIDGKLRPSSDTPTHMVLYKAWPDVCGIVHTHSATATAFAQARRVIPCLGTTHADHFRNDVPVARPLTEDEVNDAYETNTGNVIVETFRRLERNPLETPAVLCAGHGPFTWGATPEKAVENAIALEAVAHMALMTFSLRPDAAALEAYVEDKHFYRKHGSGAYYGQK